MMRSILVIFSLFLSVWCFAQDSANPFAGENTNNNSSNRYSNPKSLGNGSDKSNKPELPSTASEKAAAAVQRGGPVDPPNPVPVDDYIPVLVVIALGIIVYQKRLVKTPQSKI
ncbi:hypothetical protein SAMN05421638_2136 [Kaistella treverensis]|uniref:Signal peptidase n=1 Tax=Kaistella treverensis TaxID=631455 RepID=A0A1I3NJP4_9FLAO|nr:hypothetical protein [Kaistella treverensis]SFJ09598.1 hypothetical protein SAMN05421638_2136 [Kaistella treverensis]